MLMLNAVCAICPETLYICNDVKRQREEGTIKKKLTETLERDLRKGKRKEVACDRWAALTSLEKGIPALLLSGHKYSSLPFLLLCHTNKVNSGKGGEERRHLKVSRTVDIIVSHLLALHFVWLEFQPYMCMRVY